MENNIELLIITGPVGVGKSIVSEAVYQLLADRNIATALIDVDCFRSAFPPPFDDRFNSKLVIENLASMWPNYAELGISRLIIPNVIETSDEIEDYKSAIPNVSVTTIRLTASIPTLHKRLEKRESGSSLNWHKHRAIELKEQFESRLLEDFVIDTEEKPVYLVAEEALKQWLNI